MRTKKIEVPQEEKPIIPTRQEIISKTDFNFFQRENENQKLKFAIITKEPFERKSSGYDHFIRSGASSKSLSPTETGLDEDSNF